MGVQGDTFGKRTGAVRKNCRSLTADEIALYVNGVQALKKSGAYDQFVQLHVNAMKPTKTSRTSAAHGGPVFLPWHRRFVLEFELAMGNALGDPNYAVPYWDWTQDSGNDMAAVVWGEKFLGGGGWPVTSGPFATSAQWEAWADPGAKPDPLTADLTRECGGRYPPPSTTTTTTPPTTAPLPPPPGVALPSVAEVNNVVSLDVSAYDAAPWDKHASSGFRNLLEGFLRSPKFVDPKNEPPRTAFLHLWVHIWVGGHMGYGYSPTDPLFFLHHSFIDRLWARWQFLTLGQYGYSGVPSDNTVPPGHRQGQPMLSGFDSNGVGVPWTSDFSAGHPNPEDWDVHENFRYRYDDENTWHRTLRLRPVSQPQNWVSATYESFARGTPNVNATVPEGTPPTIGQSGWQTVVLRPGFVSSSTSSRSVSIQAAAPDPNPAHPDYPTLDPTQDPNNGMFLHAAGNALGYISPNSGNFSKDPGSAKEALTWYLTVKSESSGQAPGLQGTFLSHNGDHLLAGDGQLITGSDVSTTKQWFVLDPRADGGERVVCWHTAFSAPCNQPTPCYIDNSHCLILESNQRVVCWHHSFLKVGGTVTWGDVTVSCNCNHVDFSYCTVLQDQQRVVCHHYNFEMFGGPACGCTYVDWVNVKIIN